MKLWGAVYPESVRAAKMDPYVVYYPYSCYVLCSKEFCFWQDILSLWMVSPLLEVQLKPHHKPFFIRREWNHFLQRFSSATQVKLSLLPVSDLQFSNIFYFQDLKAADEPILSLQRNVFCSKREEQNLKDHRVLELLYEEAKFNILTGWN